MSEDIDLKAIEADLARLRPAPAAVDRDRLMFRAGQASRSPSQNVWRGVTVAFAVLSASLIGVLLLRGPRVEERVVYVPAPLTTVEVRPMPSVNASSQAFAEYHRLQERLISQGLEALPRYEAEPSRPLNIENLFE
jgi:hypothetical protein